jgi:hypothetical protein
MNSKTISKLESKLVSMVCMFPTPLIMILHMSSNCFEESSIEASQCIGIKFAFCDAYNADESS